MIIEKIKARNFRNYANLSIDLKKGIHFIIGKTDRERQMY